MAGNVRVVLKSVFDDKGIKEAQSALTKLGAGIDKAFRAVTVATGVAAVAVGKFAGDAVKAASDLQESTNAVNVAFGKAADGVLEIGKNSAESFGLARNEFNAAAVRFSAFAERVVGSGGDVAGFIGDVTQRAADFASVFNIDVAEALQVFQSGLAGEAEPLKRFGINLLESEVKAYALRAGLIAVGETMTEQQKVQARYGLLMESTAKTAGDFANTSDGLANSQRILRARFTDLQAEIGNALLPVVTELFQAFAAKLLPKLEELGAFLASPQGQKVIRDTADAFGRLFDLIVNNLGTIATTAVRIAAVVTALKAMKVALEIAAVAQRAFNLVVSANPYVIAATALIALAGGITLVSGYIREQTQEANENAKSIGAIQEEIRRLNEAYEDGLIPQDKYRAKLEQLQSQIRAVGGSIEGTAGEMSRFNNLRLDNIRAEMAATAALGARLVNQQRQLYFAMRPELGGQLPSATVPTVDEVVTGGGGPSAFERTQEIIKDAQKQFREAAIRYREAIASARQTYDKTIRNAEKSYSDAVAAAEVNRDRSLAAATKAHAENIARIQTDFANRQDDIIQQSIDRLRNAYQRAVQTNVADLFGTEEVGRSVDNLVSALQERLSASRRLLQNSAQLSAAGFSQTFIEQIVGAGTETGNELASAILDATPETQRELQGLFRALETEASSGMDTLSQTIFEKTGLATDELKRLYEQTNTDLIAALQQAEADYATSQAQILQAFDDAMQQAAKTRNDAFTSANEQLQEALTTAAQAYYDSLTEIEEAFREKIASMKGELGGLQATINQLLAALNAAKNKFAEPDFTPAPPVVTPFPVAPPVSGGTPGKGSEPTINLFVKTDTTQSPAQVGKTIATTINKYTKTGGSLAGGGGIKYTAF